METGLCLAYLHHAGVIRSTRSSARRQGMQYRLVARLEGSGCAGAYPTSTGELGNAAF
jgi:hypothetical protein